jgi:hypothetical protein
MKLIKYMEDINFNEIDRSSILIGCEIHFYMSVTKLRHVFCCGWGFAWRVEIL